MIVVVDVAVVVIIVLVRVVGVVFVFVLIVVVGSYQKYQHATKYHNHSIISVYHNQHPKK